MNLQACIVRDEDRVIYDPSDRNVASCPPALVLGQDLRQGQIGRQSEDAHAVVQVYVCPTIAHVGARAFHATRRRVHFSSKINVRGVSEASVTSPRRLLLSDANVMALRKGRAMQNREARNTHLR